MIDYTNVIKNSKLINDVYILIYFPQHHDSNKDGYVRLHRLVAEQKLGRLLKDEECVHHIDLNKHNNNPNNIIVFKTNGDHIAFHHGSICEKDGDVYYCPNKISGKEILCPICKINMMSRNSKMCVSCWSKKRQKNILDRDLLKELVYKMSFEEIGKKYSVTGNAVKNWCKIYNLPFLREIINLIPYDEWKSEIFSVETQNKIICFYESKNVTDDEIISLYNKYHSLTKVADIIPKDIKTIADILRRHDIKVLSNNEVRYYTNIYVSGNGYKNKLFHSKNEIALWLIDNGYSNLLKRNLSYNIGKSIKNRKEYLGFTFTEHK